MLDFEAYQQGVREYWRRLDRSKVTNFYEEEAEKMNWNTATRILSIGPGTGSYDAEIIQKCFPNLEHYIGVDPGEYVDEVLPRLTKVKPDLKVDIYREGAEDWVLGCKDLHQVDVVFFIEVFMRLMNVDLLRTCQQMLTPQGSIIVQTWPKQCIFSDFKQDILKEDGEFTSEDWFDKLKINVEKVNMCVKEYEIETTFNIQDPSDLLVLYMCWGDMDYTRACLDRAKKWLRSQEEDGLHKYKSPVFILKNMP